MQESIGQLKIFSAFGINATVTPGSDAFNPVFAFTHQAIEPDQYYYHPDHLGSSNYITNAAGVVNQHMEYFAFGETFVDEHLNSYNSPYKFNGKELDEETGWYYYGARYYDPKISLWLGVDPLAEKYPSISPYCYVANNPIKFIDPDGKKIKLPTLSQASTLATDLNKIYKAKYNIDNAFVAREYKSVYIEKTNQVTLDPSTWLNIFKKTEYKAKIKTEYFIDRNEKSKMNWGTDKYSSAMKEILDSPVEINVAIVDDKTKLVRYQENGIYEDLGGGKTMTSTEVCLSNKLFTYDSEGASGKFASKWSLGGVALHELLYHIHTLGEKEGGDPNIMRQYYNSKTGSVHGAGDKQSIGSE